MRRFRLHVPDINTGSMADISFLLLLFFVIMASMGVDEGIARRLPPPVTAGMSSKTSVVRNNKAVIQRNILKIYLDEHDKLYVDGLKTDLYDLKDIAKEFIANKENEDCLPEKDSKEISYFGRIAVSDRHIISLRSSREATYQSYFAIQNELAASYSELRNELAQEKWGKGYADLDRLQKRAVREVYPKRISEVNFTQPASTSGKVTKGGRP